MWCGSWECVCGIAGAFVPESTGSLKGSASQALYRMLLQLQNRGQLAAGISTFNETQDPKLRTYKDLGWVQEVFKSSNASKHKELMQALEGTTGIGHVRYATSGGSDSCFSQPFERLNGEQEKQFAFSFNGNIANFLEARACLERPGSVLSCETDTELLMHVLGAGFDASRDWREAFERASLALDGSFNVCALSGKGELVLARDPLGFRPFAWAEKDGMVLGASESAALEVFFPQKIESVQPGEVMVVREGSVERKGFARSKRKAHCMFEWVYFANAASSIEGRNVYRARYNLGKELARIEPLTPTTDMIVVGVPDTAKPIADALAHELGVPSMEGLLRNRYVGRTFIQSSHWQEKVREKFFVNREVLEGKRVLLVEDSIVRGSTCANLVRALREQGGAREVHLRIACPPIRFPCFYGIDMTTFNELLFARHEKGSLEQRGWEFAPEVVEQVRVHLGADSLVYQSLQGLVRALGIEKRSLCTACLTGEYPTPFGQKLVFKAFERFQASKSQETLEVRRSYE